MTVRRQMVYCENSPSSPFANASKGSGDDATKVEGHGVVPMGFLGGSAAIGELEKASRPQSHGGCPSCGLQCQRPKEEPRLEVKGRTDANPIV